MQQKSIVDKPSQRKINPWLKQNQNKISHATYNQEDYSHVGLPEIEDRLYVGRACEEGNHDQFKQSHQQ